MVLSVVLYVVLMFFCLFQESKVCYLTSDRISNTLNVLAVMDENEKLLLNQVYGIMAKNIF